MANNEEIWRNIGQVCKGERKTAGNYKWAFEMEVVV